MPRSWRTILSWEVDTTTPDLSHPDEAWIGHTFQRNSINKPGVYWVGDVTRVEENPGWRGSYYIWADWTDPRTGKVEGAFMVWNSQVQRDFILIE
jgi:hypothetical protein